MRLTSWNVNGLRAIVTKDFEQSLACLAPDVMGLQETKAQEDQVRAALFGLDGYELFSSSAEKKGYSGTAILTRTTPMSVQAGIGVPDFDQEGRVLRAEFPSFHFVTVYTPNSSSGLKRLPFRKAWDAAFRDYLSELDKDKPVVCCGDLNVAHAPIDLARPEANYNKTPGYTQDEIDGMTALLEAGFVDTWRQAHPGKVKYSWWSYRGGAREKNVGWRLDYMLVSSRALAQVDFPEIHTDIHGSDHCPVSLTWRI
ncbi:MAG: exodeoxyribonuclease III [Bacteroidetes bacterium]|nr:exodeoxyribonuclease III [Bacteroidota bacterium]MDA0903036.1 exodeoxyribonuclease III [Bacteroidota bacterium]MDA1241754.1 exodeoxyribonuclease III [Bacteroidota bacterium]